MPTAMPHTAKAIVVTCIDERLAPTISATIEQLPGGAFHAALAGGGAAFAADPDLSVALKQVVAAYRINRITNVYLQSHRDCGAYGLAGVTFASPEEEATRLYADLDAAADKVKAALEEAGADLSAITVHTEVIALDGQVVPRPS